MGDIHAAFERLLDQLRDLDKTFVAFSGGVDSTLLLDVAHEVLADRVIAVTAIGPLFPAFETEQARSFCREKGIRHIELLINQLDDEQIAANSPDRCYLCKRLIFSRIVEEAARLGVSSVTDGTNADDVFDHRPGMIALSELGIKSPLKNAGLNKDMIRELSRTRNLPTAELMSCACYASRFPYGVTIAVADVQRVAMVEEKLRSLAFQVYRARHFGKEVRLEFSEKDFRLLLREDVRERISNIARQAGYQTVTVDLAGYRTGSLSREHAVDEGSV